MRVWTGAALILLAGCSGGHHGSTPVVVTIESIAPAFGTRLGGETVTLTGSGFGAKPFVTFGASNVTTFVSATDSEIKLIAPADHIGPASITVANASGGIQTRVAGYDYLPLAAKPYQARFFADAADAAHANLVVVGTAGTIGSLDIDVPLAASGSISGLLTDSSGAPLAGHVVVASKLDGSIPPIAFPARLDGAFTIEGLPAGSYRVTSAEGIGSDRVDLAWDGASGVDDENLALAVDVAAGADSPGVTLALPPGARIDGVVAGGGVGLEGLSVFAVDDGGRSLQFTYATTASGGTYTLHGLASGSYRLVAFAFGTGRVSEWWPNALTSAAATPIVLSSGGSAAAPFALDTAGSISGIVQDPGTLRIPFVTIVGTELASGAQFTSSTGSDGSYLLPGLPAGAYRLEAPELGQFYSMVTTTAAATNVVVGSGASVANIDWIGKLFPLPVCGDPAGTASLSGTVLGPMAAKILRARILISTTAGLVSQAVSGPDGKWSADCLPPDAALSVLVEPMGTDLVRQPLAISPIPAGGAAVADATVSHGPKLKGRVRDAQSHSPLSGVVLSVTNVATGETGFAATDPDGNWTVDRTAIGGLFPGSYRVEARVSVQTDFSAN